eukprot:3218568-Heterocapsa_arctica.AAC.1
MGPPEIGGWAHAYMAAMTDMESQLAPDALDRDHVLPNFYSLPDHDYSARAIAIEMDVTHAELLDLNPLLFSCAYNGLVTTSQKRK